MLELLKPGQVWRPKRGLGYGLLQQSVVGVVSLDARAIHGLPRLEAALPDFVDEPVPAPRQGQPAEERLLTLFAFVHAAIQREGRIPVSNPFHLQRRQLQAGQAPSFDLCLPAASFEASPLALKWARTLCNGLLQGAQGERLASLHTLRQEVLDQLARFANPSVNKYCILLAAYRLRVPVLTFDMEVMQLGTGCHARWMESSLTDLTPAIGVRFAKLKHHTARVLRAGGLPGGEHKLVGTPQEAVECAAQLGYPVVVKPADEDRGVGVSADLRDDHAVRGAWEAARAVSANVLVEKFAPGLTHRLTVFQGEVIRVSRRIAGGVTGDGIRNVAELVTLAQQTELHRRSQRRHGEAKLALDEEAIGLLEQEGLQASHVPAAGAYVRLRRRDNMNAGGSSETIPLGDVHPANLQLARDAARLMRLDFAGVDLITTDIASSWLEVGGLICEVNAKPQMGARKEPELWDRVVSEMVGPCSRIPARLLIVADDDAREMAAVRALASQAPTTSVSSRFGLWINGQRSTLQFANGFAATLALLRRTDVTAATCLMSLGDLERKGLPLDLWDSIESAEPFDPQSAQGKRLRALMAMARRHIKTQVQGVS
ncbi:acetate--CoA ligase family protein [Caenimonas sp. SL110]|uniref:acetate--CoA ligase family protein n=1 Tax=Caenimonas sp. SL110 TaxID=1450524 RepID=UPI0006548B0F|nr:acetate--CoA ligase family protein [Caenimonas sp. SL110]